MFRSDVRSSVLYADKHYTNNKNIRSLRKLVEFMDQRHSIISIAGILFHTLMETMSVALYVWTSEVSRAQSIEHFDWALPVFVAEVVLNIIFFLEWVALFFLEEDKKSYLISWLSVVNALTSVPMIIIGAGALHGKSWRHGWVPMYLRVWWINDCIWVLLDYPQISYLMVEINREMSRFSVKLFAVLCTCIGTQQIVESCVGTYVDLYNSAYMMVVTFATIGFGDVVAHTTPARMFMTVFIVVGMAFFLPLSQRLALIGERKRYYNTFRGSSSKHGTHVIIAGSFDDAAVDVLLFNFYSGWRKYLNTKIVLLTTEEPTEEVQLTRNLPWFKERVQLMIGDPGNEVDLHRADAHRADAIFLFGNSRSSAYYHDFAIIGQAMAISLFDPDLPQHIMLRRGRTVKQIAPFASSALELERTVHRLIGLSMVRPGMVPLIINLLRTYERMPVDLTLNRHWVDQYEYSIRNDLFGITVPDALRGREFRLLAKAFYDHDVTLIGILDVRNVVHLNPGELIPNAQKLLLIAKTVEMVEVATETIAKRYEETFGEEMLVAPDPDDFMKNAWERRMTNHDDGRGGGGGAVSGTLAGRRTNNAPFGSPTFGAPSLDATHPYFDGDSCCSSCEGDEDDFGEEPPAPPSNLVQVEDAFDCVNHFIIIDLSSVKSTDRSSRYAQEATLTTVAHDLANVMAPIRQNYPRNRIVLLTSDVSFAPYFDLYWDNDGGYRSRLVDSSSPPVSYVFGCGLNRADLLRCNLQQCAGCCIFFAGDISSCSSASAVSMLVVLSIGEILHGTPTFPVVVEMEGLGNLQLFPPYAEDVRLRSKAEIDFVFEPNFLIGNAISRLMLLPALQRTYFMPESIDVMDVLISGHNPDTPSVAHMPLLACEAELDTYHDVVTHFIKSGFLPIALHRRIFDPRNPAINGQRFVITNPPRGLPVFQESDSVFYLTPGQ